MPRRSNTKETVLLALELLRRIPRGKKVTAGELHEQLADYGIERDIRTVQRQLDMLSLHFGGIERDMRSIPYGYSWSRDSAGFSMPLLSPQESLLLTLAEQYLRNLLPASLFQTMEPFFAQARSNLDPVSGASLEAQWPSKVRVVSTTQPLLPPKLEPGVFEAVSSALYANHWLDIEYCNATGASHTAEIMPLGLAQQGSRLYLVCRYAGRDDERILALNRIQAARELQRGFERPSDFNLEKYDADGGFGFGHGKRIRLRFHIDKDAGKHLLESPLSEDQRVVEHDDYYAITATVVQTAMLDWWLRGFGEEVWMVRRTAIAAKRDRT